MLFKKIMAASLACVMAISFASCGKSGSTTTTTAKDNTAKKTLVLATNAAFPPFEFVVGTDGSEFDGIDILIGKEIAKDMNCELKIENMDFESTLSAIASGKADLVLAGMTVKPDRLENADFSMPYWTAEQTIIVNDKNTDIKNVASLKGK
ncbi:MAG: transporter substrate-binding domain-containing protein, partial [Clostridia bacterium]